jgi:tetratricopeptide (TPR) repeat protein
MNLYFRKWNKQGIVSHQYSLSGIGKHKSIKIKAAYLVVFFTCAGLFSVKSAETLPQSNYPISTDLDRSRAGIAQLRARLIEEGCSREMSNQVIELSRRSDLRVDEIELVVHYAVFCTGPNAGEIFINSLIANRDIKQIKLRASRRFVRDAVHYFGNESMVQVLDDIESRLAPPERARVASLSDDEIRHEIEKYKNAPNPDLRDQLSGYAGFLFNLRPQIYSEIVNAVLETDPENPGLLAAKGLSYAQAGDFANAKETLEKAWKKKSLDALLPYGGAIAQTDDLPAADSLTNDLIRYQKWDEQIPKVLLAFAFIMQKEPERYRATIEKILANVVVADLKDEEGKQLREKLMQSWNEK